MSVPWPGILAALVFLLIVSVWNWITGILPGSISGTANWILLLLAAIVAIVVFLKTSNS